MRGEAGWVRVERERVRSQYGVVYDDGSDLSYLPICEEGVGGEGRKAVSVVVIFIYQLESRQGRGRGAGRRLPPTAGWLGRQGGH